MDLSIRNASAAEVRRLIESAIKLFVVRVAEEIEQEIRDRAHTSPAHISPKDKATLDAYYRDGKMPFWSGQLLNSISVEETPTGATVSIGAPYASEIEEGDLKRQPIEGRLAEWADDHDIEGRGEGWITTGREHPFVHPVLLDMFEGGDIERIARGAFEDTFKSANIGRPGSGSPRTPPPMPRWRDEFGQWTEAGEGKYYSNSSISGFDKQGNFREYTSDGSRYWGPPHERY